MVLGIAFGGAYGRREVPRFRSILLLHITVGKQSLQVASKQSVPHFKPQLQFHKPLKENGAIMLPFYNLKRHRHGRYRIEQIKIGRSSRNHNPSLRKISNSKKEVNRMEKKSQRHKSRGCFYFPEIYWEMWLGVYDKNKRSVGVAVRNGNRHQYSKCPAVG